MKTDYTVGIVKQDIRELSDKYGAILFEHNISINQALTKDLGSKELFNLMIMPDDSPVPKMQYSDIKYYINNLSKMGHKLRVYGKSSASKLLYTFNIEDVDCVRTQVKSSIGPFLLALSRKFFIEEECIGNRDSNWGIMGNISFRPMPNFVEYIPPEITNSTLLMIAKCILAELRCYTNTEMIQKVSAKILKSTYNLRTMHNIVSNSFEENGFKSVQDLRRFTRPEIILSVFIKNIDFDRRDIWPFTDDFITFLETCLKDFNLSESRIKKMELMETDKYMGLEIYDCVVLQIIKELIPLIKEDQSSWYYRKSTKIYKHPIELSMTMPPRLRNRVCNKILSRCQILKNYGIKDNGLDVLTLHGDRGLEFIKERAHGYSGITKEIFTDD